MAPTQTLSRPAAFYPALLLMAFVLMRAALWSAVRCAPRCIKLPSKYNNVSLLYSLASSLQVNCSSYQGLELSMFENVN